ncbi:hypothetical protein D3C77_789870 [compost metagenome]
MADDRQVKLDRGHGSSRLELIISVQRKVARLQYGQAFVGQRMLLPLVDARQLLLGALLLHADLAGIAI